MDVPHLLALVPHLAHRVVLLAQTSIALQLYGVPIKPTVHPGSLLALASESPRNRPSTLRKYIRPRSLKQQASAHAVEERGPEFLLKLGDGAGERRLRHMERLGGLGDALKLRDLNEISQLMKLHALHPSDGALYAAPW